MLEKEGGNKDMVFYHDLCKKWAMEFLPLYQESLQSTASVKRFLAFIKNKDVNWISFSV